MIARSKDSLCPPALLLGAMCAVAACSSGARSSDDGEPAAATDGAGGSPPNEAPGLDPDPQGDPLEPPAPGFDLYDANAIPRFSLTLDDEAMAVLRSPLVETHKEWVHARFSFGAIVFEDVGVRRKGSTTFRPLPQKASLKVKFNKWVKGQKLAGLEEITLNNMASDPTFLAERITYHVFRAMGLPAPRANTAELTINDEYYGIFANVETPDENFLDRAFGKGVAVSLYEVNWGSSWLPNQNDGFEIDIELPNAPPDAMPDAEALFRAVEAARDVTLLQDLECCLHTREWLRHSAAEAVTGHYDGYAFGVWGSHNYFMAGDRSGRFALVPWSADLALSDRLGVVDAAHPLGDIVLARCKLSEACWSAYRSEVADALAVYESLGLVDLAQTWHEQIADRVAQDPKRPTSMSFHEFETERLFTWLARRPAVVRAQLDL